MNKGKSLFASSTSRSRARNVMATPEWNFSDLILVSDLCRAGEKKRDFSLFRLGFFSVSVRYLVEHGLKS